MNKIKLLKGYFTTNKIILGFLWIIFLSYWYLKIKVTTAGVDVGYFLSISRDVYQKGLIPFYTIRSIYSPLGYYIFGFPYLFFKSLNFQDFLYFNFVLLFITGYLGYKVLSELSVNHKGYLTLVFTIICSPMCYDIKLELPVLIFAMASNLYLLKYIKERKSINLILSGLLIGIAILIKQYAIVLIPLSITLFLLLDKSNLKNRKISLRALLIMLSSTLIFVFFIFCIFHFVFGVSEIHLLRQFLGRVEYDCLGDYGDRNLIYLLKGLRFYLLKFPVVFLLLFVLIWRQHWKKLKFYIILLIFTLLPYYFKVYPHYFFFGFSSVFVGTIFLLEKFEFRVIFFLSLALTFFLEFYAMFILKRDFQNLLIKKNDETALLYQFKSVVKPGTTAFITSHKQLYFLCDLRSVDAEKISYEFLPIGCLEKYLSFNKFQIKSFIYIGNDSLIKLKNYSPNLMLKTQASINYKSNFIINYSRNY